MSRAITIVGASVRAAASSAARAGFAVYAADLFADVDLRRDCQVAIATTYTDGLSKIVSGSQSGGWMYTGALENYPSLVDEMAAIRPLWGNAGKVLCRVRDPLQIADVLRGAGLPCPAAARSSASLSSEMRWLKKSLHSAGGARVSRWSPPAEPPDCSPDEYFQQFVDGQPCSAVYVADKRTAVLLGVTRQLIGAAWTGASGFRYAGSIGPVALSESATSQFVAIGSALVQAFGLIGLFGVDAIVNPAGVWSVEVNPRYTASTELLDLAFGFQAVDLHIEACESGKLPTALPSAAELCFGKAILFATRGFVVPSELTARLEAENNSKQARVADIPVSGSVVQAGWPVITLLAEAIDEHAVFQSLRQRASEIQSWWAN